MCEICVFANCTAGDVLREVVRTGKVCYRTDSSAREESDTHETYAELWDDYKAELTALDKAYRDKAMLDLRVKNLAEMCPYVFAWEEDQAGAEMESTAGEESEQEVENMLLEVDGDYDGEADMVHTVISRDVLENARRHVRKVRQRRLQAQGDDGVKGIPAVQVLDRMRQAKIEQERENRDTEIRIGIYKERIMAWWAAKRHGVHDDPTTRTAWATQSKQTAAPCEGAGPMRRRNGKRSTG
ncbi:hypothetical protein BD626DRAFT_543793 [Schizophyllum amplum]|uniref:Uncharacterized protein n=1 Tax=Schizophyllum amplum TaxID=97359 RepID=A0A550BRE2_9AGAR|nr:hypothetical protein BD626DRAFT_543793 [Auriculariopsis ampla]